MDNEYIKVGETYYVRVQVAEKKGDKIITRTVSEKGIFLEEATTTFFGKEALAFTPINSYPPLFHMTKVPETFPKYDPNRKFRKKDKVRVIRRDGRIGSTSIKVGDTAIVEEAEDDDNIVVLRNPSPKGQPFICIHSLFLELITPVEELEPYCVEEETLCWLVLNERIRGKAIVCEFIKKFHPNAKAAAEAERDRLNAEYRKEQSNGLGH
jgi:hypothetical protein